MNKKALFPLVVLLAVGVFFSLRLIADQHGWQPDGQEVNIEPYLTPDGATLTKNQAILSTISKVIADGHYSPKDLNDDFSQRVFQRYMGMTDYGKLFFLTSDIEDFKKYENKIDDEIREGGTHLYDSVSARFKVRLEEAEAY